MSCPISRQCDEHAVALSAEDARSDAIETYGDAINADYGRRLEELGDALAGFGLDEEEIGAALAEHRYRKAGDARHPVLSGCFEALRAAN